MLYSISWGWEIELFLGITATQFTFGICELLVKSEMVFLTRL